MGDSKLTGLSELTTLKGGDIFYVVDDPQGAKISRYITADTINNFITADSLDATKYGVSVSNTAALNTYYMQLLVDAKAAVGGGVIYIPTGRYYFASGGTLFGKYAVSVPSNITIRGDGMYQTVLYSADAVADPATHYCIFQVYGLGLANEKKNIVFQDLGFEGTNIGTLMCTGTENRGIMTYGSYVHDTLVDRCRFEYFWEAGIALYAWAPNSYNNNITNCQINYNGEDGLNTSFNKSHITNNYCCNNYTGGMEIVCKDSVITGNVCKGNGTGGIVLGGDTSDTRTNHIGWWNTLSNNICTENGGIGIMLTHSTCHSVVSSNVCMMNNGAGIHILEELATYPNSHVQYNLITDNICVCNGVAPTAIPFGILVEGSHNTIRNNECYDLALAGYEQKYGIILQTTADYSLVVDNHCFGNTLGQYVDIGSTGTIFKFQEQNITTFTNLVTTPDVTYGNNFKTGNTGPTTYTMFLGGSTGREIWILINDAFSVFDFTGTNLKGNGGADWSPAAGDTMRAVFDGTNWYCECHDNT